MYSYIYDAFLQNKKFSKSLARIENAITDHQIQGRICRLSLINTLNATILDEIRKGAKTIVIIGNDKTISKALDSIVPYDITLGVIPIGTAEENQIAQFLGIPPEEDACKILSSRITKTIPLGKVNDSFFIYNATINSQNAILTCNHTYQISLLDDNDEISIYNNPENNQKDSLRFLTTEICYKKEKNFLKKIIPKKDNNLKTSLKTFTVTVNSSQNNIPILIDGQKVINSPAIIEPSEKSLKVIVGKERKLK